MSYKSYDKLSSHFFTSVVLIFTFTVSGDALRNFECEVAINFECEVAINFEVINDKF